MANTDPQVVKFTDERVRVRTEQIRALYVVMRDDKRQWLSEVRPLVDNDATLIPNDREAQGVTTLTGADLTLILAKINSLLVTLEAAGTIEIIQKATVRPLEVVQT